MFTQRGILSELLYFGYLNSPGKGMLVAAFGLGYHRVSGIRRSKLKLRMVFVAWGLMVTTVLMKPPKNDVASVDAPKKGYSKLLGDEIVLPQCGLEGSSSVPPNRNFYHAQPGTVLLRSMSNSRVNHSSL